MGVIRLFVALFQWRSCILSAWFSFPRDRIVLPLWWIPFSYLFVGWNFLVSFCFVTLTRVLTAILHILLLCRVSCRYAPGLLVVLCCFIVRRVRFSAVSFSNVCDHGEYSLIEYLYTVGSYGGARIHRVYFTVRNMEDVLYVRLFLTIIDRLQLTSSPPCWMTINKRIIVSSIVPVIQNGRQGLCHLNLTGMVANHLYFEIEVNTGRIFTEP